MHTPRFWLEADLSTPRTVLLPQAVFHHAKTVLRLRQDAPIVLFNGHGGEAQATLDTHTGTATIVRFDPVERESPLPVTLIQSWINPAKLDWVVEKSVELGVTRFILVPASRCVTQLSGPRLNKRLEHLRAVVIHACCQSGRTRIPQITTAPTFLSGLTEGATGTQAILLAPHTGHTLQALLTPNAPQGVSIAVGPEGGFSDEEIAQSARLGYRCATLGPRTLRTETAGLAAVSVLQSIWGDLR